MTEQSMINDEIYNETFPFFLERGLNQPYVNLKCLNHGKKITIVWNGKPTIECNDDKCVNSTIKNFWKNQKKWSKQQKRMAKAKKIKKGINKIFENKEADYDGYIAVPLIQILLKLKILEAKKESLFQFRPLLRMKTNSEIKLHVALSYLINNLDAKIMNCCVNCRFSDKKDWIKNKDNKNKTLHYLMKIIINSNKPHGNHHIFSRELDSNLMNYNFLIDAERFENIIMENYRTQTLRKFNYISLSIATIFSISSLIVMILAN